MKKMANLKALFVSILAYFLTPVKKRINAYVLVFKQSYLQARTEGYFHWAERTLAAPRRSGISPVAAVITVFIVALVIVVIVYVMGTLQLNLNTSGLPADAQTAIGNTFTTTYSGIEILVISVLALSAVALISIFTGGFGGRGEKL